MLAGAAALLVVPLIVLVFWPRHEGRWPIAGEALVVTGVTTSQGKLSFFVPLNQQPTNSVLRSKPLHYLRPYRLQRSVGGEWVDESVEKRMYWAEVNSAKGLQRCLSRFFVRPTSGEYRALMVYRFRGRWDFFRRRMANRLPRFMSSRVLALRADGAVWTAPFSVMMEPLQETVSANGVETKENESLPPLSEE